MPPLLSCPVLSCPVLSCPAAGAAADAADAGKYCRLTRFGRLSRTTHEQTPGCATAHFGSNVEFLQHDFASLLNQAFPHLDGATITTFVIGLFDQTMALPQFKVGAV